MDLTHHQSGRVRRKAARNVVFVGNCQLAAIATFYKRCFAPRRDENVRIISPKRELSPDERRALGKADLVVWQVIESKTAVTLADVAGAAELIKVPLISATFLWPFSGRPHPSNFRTPHAPNGPFDAELGDVFLNALVRERVSPDEAVRRYLELDLASRTNLDRLFDFWRDGQLRRDRVCGFESASTIERCFRTEQVFLTPHHPNLMLFRHLTEQLLTRLGFSRADITNAFHSITSAPGAPTALPIHPAVARHFGLKWVSKGKKYPLRHEGYVTFEEFVRRYVHFDWNEPLAEGFLALVGKKTQLARRKLEEGLARAPNSIVGRIALGHVLLNDGEHHEALTLAREAIDLDGNSPEAATLVAECLNAVSHTDAERFFRLALSIAPSHGDASAGLAELYLRAGRPMDALEAAEYGLSASPGDPRLLDVAAKALRQSGRPADTGMILNAALAGVSLREPIRAQERSVLGEGRVTHAGSL